MRRRRFNWTRERYYSAKRLSRLMCALSSECIPHQQPGLAKQYCDLMQPIWDQRDPFERPLWLRNEDRKPDGIPF